MEHIIPPLNPWAKWSGYEADMSKMFAHQASLLCFCYETAKQTIQLAAIWAQRNKIWPSPSLRNVSFLWPRHLISSFGSFLLLRQFVSGPLLQLCLLLLPRLLSGQALAVAVEGGGRNKRQAQPGSSGFHILVLVLHLVLNHFHSRQKLMLSDFSQLSPLEHTVLGTVGAQNLAYTRYIFFLLYIF